MTYGAGSIHEEEFSEDRNGASKQIKDIDENFEFAHAQLPSVLVRKRTLNRTIR